MHILTPSTYILLPNLVQDVGDTGGGDAGSGDGEAAGKVVVVELHTGTAVLISYHVGIPVEGAAGINSAFYRAVGILR